MFLDIIVKKENYVYFKRKYVIILKFFFKYFNDK